MLIYIDTTYFLQFTTFTFRATLTCIMFNWCLPEFSMFWTGYTNFCKCSCIFYFGIVIFVSMYLYRFFYKFILTYCQMSSTFWTTLMTIYMFIWCLPKLTMFWTRYKNFNVSINIFYFGIVISIFMSFFCFFNKVLFGHFFYSHNNSDTLCLLNDYLVSAKTHHVLDRLYKLLFYHLYIPFLSSHIYYDESFLLFL